MHRSNKIWLSDLKKKYPKSFSRAKVLELGSGDTTGELTIRSGFKNCEYTGVDRVGGDHGVYGVDIIKDAKRTKFKNDYFDTLICFSMFEHDPEWQLSLSHNLKFLRLGAMIFISFGAEGNRRHDPEPWAQVKYGDFLKFCSTLPIKVLDAFFEEERYGYDCPGAFNVVAQRKDTIEKDVNKYLISNVRLVPPRSHLQLLIGDAFYYVNRFKINLRNKMYIKRKYFYS